MSDKTTPKLGTILSGDERRDAIHIAVAPVLARERLKPGEPVGLAVGRTDVADRFQPPLGLVDPFLQTIVEPGQQFYLFLYPQTITSLRHEWVHPAFDRGDGVPPASSPALVPTKEESRTWMGEFRERWNFNEDDIKRVAAYPDAYMTARDRDLHSKDELGEDYELFWKHLENITGRRFDEEWREGTGWSCVC